MQSEVGYLVGYGREERGKSRERGGERQRETGKGKMFNLQNKLTL